MIRLTRIRDVCRCLYCDLPLPGDEIVVECDGDGAGLYHVNCVERMVASSITEVRSLVAHTPACPDAEANFLGACLISDEAVALGKDMPITSMFAVSHQMILQAIQEVSPVDVCTVAEWLRSRGNLEMVGGGAYLTELIDAVPHAGHAADYKRLIMQAAAKRELLRVAERIPDLVRRSNGSISDVCRAARDMVVAPYVDLKDRGLL